MKYFGVVFPRYVEWRQGFLPKNNYSWWLHNSTSEHDCKFTGKSTLLPLFISCLLCNGKWQLNGQKSVEVTPYGLVGHRILKSWTLMWSWTPLCGFNSHNSSGKDSLQSFWVCLWEFLLIQPFGQLDENDWLGVGVIIPSKHFQWSWGQANQVAPQQTRLTRFLLTPLCARGAPSCQNSKEPLSNCRHKIGKAHLTKMSLYLVALKRNCHWFGENYSSLLIFYYENLMAICRILCTC